MRTALAAISAVLVSTSAARADVVVTPLNMGSWAFANSDGNGVIGNNPTGVGQMVTGPATPPAGIGSANLATGNGTSGGDGAEVLSTTAYAGTLLSDLSALTYHTYDTLNNGQQFPYLSIEIATGNVTDPEDILFFEPPYQTPSTGNPSLPNQGDTVLNEWQSWNALEGGWWDNNGVGGPGDGVVSLATIEAAYPDATIENYSSELTPPDGLGGIGFNVGFASATDQFNGYVDDFTIGIGGANTTYDFEPAIPAPEPGTIALLGAALFWLGAIGVRRQRGYRRGGSAAPYQAQQP
ncbi:MAG: PEP-CTERM sorting domain-containing protein [Stellaceae bacterium]